MIFDPAFDPKISLAGSLKKFHVTTILILLYWHSNNFNFIIQFKIRVIPLDLCMLRHSNTFLTHYGNQQVTLALADFASKVVAL